VAALAVNASDPALLIAGRRQKKLTMPGSRQTVQQTQSRTAVTGAWEFLGVALQAPMVEDLETRQ
jgi:hypothetical protein